MSENGSDAEIASWTLESGPHGSRGTGVSYTKTVSLFLIACSASFRHALAIARNSSLFSLSEALWARSRQFAACSLYAAAKSLPDIHRPASVHNPPATTQSRTDSSRTATAND
jgi:hypothetical protein